MGGEQSRASNVRKVVGTARAVLGSGMATARSNVYIKTTLQNTSFIRV